MRDRVEPSCDPARSHRALAMPGHVRRASVDRPTAPSRRHGRVNRLSGAARFILDTMRFPKLASGFVVEDFLNTESGKAPIEPDDRLEHVKPDPFDDRRRAWADAIFDLHKNRRTCAADAGYVQPELKNHTWTHRGQAPMLSLAEHEGDTRQGPSGTIMAS